MGFRVWAAEVAWDRFDIIASAVQSSPDGERFLDVYLVDPEGGLTERRVAVPRDAADGREEATLQDEARDSAAEEFRQAEGVRHANSVRYLGGPADTELLLRLAYQANRQDALRRIEHETHDFALRQTLHRVLQAGSSAASPPA